MHTLNYFNGIGSSAYLLINWKLLACVRRDKLNRHRLFKFCMWVGGHYSDFKLVKECWFELAIAESTPFNYSARGGGAKVPYIPAVYNLKSEFFEKIWKSMQAVMINCEFSLPGLNTNKIWYNRRTFPLALEMSLCEQPASQRNSWSCQDPAAAQLSLQLHKINRYNPHLSC